VAEAAARGERVVVVGDPLHPEVRATVAWAAPAEVTVVQTEDEARALPAGGPVFVVAQTTFHEEAFQRIQKCLEASRPADAVRVENTICDATRLRQDACRELAQQVDCMVVVGDEKSSNTRKLFEIAQEYAKKNYFIENKNKTEKILQHFNGCNKMGVTAGASTPIHVVEEVISIMSDYNFSESQESNPMHEFMEEIDKSTRLPRNGEVVTGEVIQVTDGDVTINLGCKKDGVIPKSEVSLEEGQTLQDVFKEGDEVQAKVLKNDDGEGNILLSKKRVIVSEHWETINQACEDKIPLEVKVVREVNGGVIATFNEVSGFIPLSQLSDRYVEKADEFVGQDLTVKVIRVDQKRNKVVFSHKAVLNEARQKRMQEIWESLSVGDVIDGKVMRFTEYGAFVDIGGVDGLLHISEISWGKLRHPSDMLAIGQEIKVKILSMNKEKEKISLGYKQNQPEPWSVIGQKYQVGQVIHGKAVQLKDYGVFVEIEPGLDGLVHISEIAYRRVTDISDELEVGQEVSAKILEIDQDRKRISLSIRETLDREADLAKENAPKAAPAEAAEPAPAAEAEEQTVEVEPVAATEFDVPDVAAVEIETTEIETGEAPEDDVAALAEQGDPSTQEFDPDKDQEQEIPDPDGVDAEGGSGEAPVPEYGPSDQLADPDKDQELEMPDPDGIDAVPAPEDLAQPGDPSTQEFDPDKDQEQEIPDPQ
jgi:4-hydroxy-3-methylbut-2-enyl diphosphate reductase